ncbi:MAG: hypothetical protein ACOZNI_30975 [Myxococcota bacterium]
MLARLLLVAAIGLAVAAAVAGAIDGLDDHVRVFGLCGGAVAVAVGRALTRGRRWSDEATDGALVAGIALAAIDREGSWPALFGGIAAGLAVLAGLAHRLGARVAVAVGVVGLAVAATQSPGRVLPGLHTWNQYHYVLGTKYYAEVGYQDLYVATLLADEDGAGHFAKVRRVRDMRTYDYVPRAEALAKARAEGLRERFTDARWADFKHDLDVFWPLMGAATWPSVLTDLGFNPSPVWVAIHQPILKVVPLSKAALQGLAALQIPMYAAMLAASAWAFGARATLWLVLWNVLFFGSRGRLYGGYWSYDWLALVVVAAALVAKGRPALAAVPVAIGGLMRGFGGLLATGPAVQWAATLLRERRLDAWATRFLVSLAITMLGLGALSLTAGRGLDAWPDWLDKIEFHSWRISTGGRHLGLKVLFGEDWSTPGHTADLDARREIYRSQAWAYHVVQGVLIAWTAWVAWRRARLDAALLGMIPAFATMVLSRYYYAAWSVLLLLGTRDGDREPRLPVALGMLAILALHEGQFLIEGTTPDSRHQAVNLLLLALAVVTLAVYTVGDLRGRRDLAPRDPSPP